MKSFSSGRLSFIDSEGCKKRDPTSIYSLFMQKLIIRFFVSFHFDPGLVSYHDLVVIIAGVESSSLFAKTR